MRQKDSPVAAAAWAPGRGEAVALRPGVMSAESEDGGLHLLSWQFSATYGEMTERERMVVRLLAAGPRTRRDLLAEDSDERALDQLLSRLWQDGWLNLTVLRREIPLYTISPLRPPPSPPADDGDGCFVLSRLAILRRGESGFVVESPRAWCELLVHDSEALAMIGEVLVCGTATVGQGSALRRRLLRDLRWASLVVPRSSPEETELQLAQWSSHELWFHERTRLGYRGYGGRYGPTAWARGRFEPPTPRPPEATGLALPRADLDRLRQVDWTLTATLEDRRSARRHDDERPLTADQLGEFLYRCARTTVRKAEDGEHVGRPYPAGGSPNTLELYPVVRLVVGVNPGLYRYDPNAHQLLHVRPLDRAVRRLLKVASLVARVSEPPQVLFVVAARFEYVMWTYEAMGYALVLKNVGSLFQTMYCVATAMGLAGCALGGGDSVAFSRASGLDPFAESSVGEFILGSRREE